jgi:hypothetical protein
LSLLFWGNGTLRDQPMLDSPNGRNLIFDFYFGRISARAKRGNS